MSSRPKIEDLRFSSSSFDDFFAPKKPAEPALQPRVATGRVRVGSLADIGRMGFAFVASDTLVRTSKQDFWRLGQDDEGHFVERLVSDDEGPVVEK